MALALPGGVKKLLTPTSASQVVAPVVAQQAAQQAQRAIGTGVVPPVQATYVTGAEQAAARAATQAAAAEPLAIGAAKPFIRNMSSAIPTVAAEVAPAAGGILGTLANNQFLNKGMLGKYAATEGAGLKGLAGKAGLGLAAGYGVDYATDQVFRAFNGGENPEGRWDETLGGALGGAAAGTMMFGPGLGTLGGAIIGGAWEFLQGDESEAKQRKKDAKNVGLVETQARTLMGTMGVDPEEQAKILATLQFQSKSGNLNGEQTAALYNEQLMPLVDAATKDGARNDRMAAFQAYTLPKFTCYLDESQARADDFSKANNNPVYAMQAAQMNASYMSQLQALTSMASPAAQSGIGNGTLDDMIAGRQAQAQITAAAKLGR